MLKNASRQYQKKRRDPDELRRTFQPDHTSFLRLNYYPRCPTPEAPEGLEVAKAGHLDAAFGRRGIQVGTIDALLAQLCLHHDLVLMTTDADFAHIAEVCPLVLWPR